MLTYIRKYILLLAIFLFAGWSFAQDTDTKEGVLKGVVRSSATGEPIAGASVSIPGLTSSITEDDGSFSLQKTQEGAVLHIQVPGYAVQKVAVQGKTEFVIYLYDESFKSAYETFDTPFGSQEIITSTASLSTSSNKDSYKRGVVNVENVLQGGALGLNTIIRSGAPGSGGNMYLRGFNSINATSQPLIVVDGMPYENFAIGTSLVPGNVINPLSGLDVKDIESISILKDATSIYGSRGANGVILINTAKAKSQVTAIDFYAYMNYSMEPNTQYRMMNSWQSKTYLSEMYASNGYTPQQIQELPVFNQEVPVSQKWGVEGNKDYYRYNHNTNWQDKIFRGAFSQNYGISVKGGDDIALYALSVGYMGNDGIIENTDYSRYNTQFNTQINMTANIKLNANINFSYGSRNLIHEGESPNFNPMYVSLIKSPFMSTHLYDENGVVSPNFEQADIYNVSNPEAIVNGLTSLTSKNYRLFGNMEGIFNLNKYFKINALFGLTFDKTREHIFLPSDGLYHDMLPSAEVKNQMQASVSRYIQYYADLRLGYHRTFNDVHSLTGRVGFRYQTNDMEDDWTRAYNSSSDNLQTIGEGDIALTQNGGQMEKWKWMSYYLNTEYGFKNKYFAALNMALDGSSRFGKEASGLKMFDNVFGLFPSLTAAWLVSSEDFMAGVKPVDLLKFRIGYSIAGNDDIGNYTTRSIYSSQNFLGYYGFVRGNLTNPELKWETTSKFNVGLDVALFNERLNFSFDVYKNKTKDLLMWTQADGAAGISLYAENDGTLQNTGLDFGVNARIVNNRDIKWDMGLNISHYKNKVTELSADSKITEIANGYVRTKVGSPIGQFYGYKTDGVYSTTSEAQSAGLNIRNENGTLTAFAAGDMRFVDMDGNKVIDEDDMVVIGDPNPDLYGSITTALQYKRLKLDAIFVYSLGNDVYNSLRRDLESMTGYENQTEAIVNRWTYEGQVTNIPRAAYGDPMGNSRFSDRWIEDGSYLRMKSVTLSYDFPIKRSFIKGVQAYVTGSNLLTFTKYLGYDPEFSAGSNPLYYGIDTGLTPHPRSILFGVKIGL